MTSKLLNHTRPVKKERPGYENTNRSESPLHLVSTINIRI